MGGDAKEGRSAPSFTQDTGYIAPWPKVGVFSYDESDRKTVSHPLFIFFEHKLFLKSVFERRKEL